MRGKHASGSEEPQSKLEDRQRKQPPIHILAKRKELLLEDLWLSWRGMASEVVTTIPNAGGKEMRGLSSHRPLSALSAQGLSWSLASTILVMEV